MVFKRLLVIHLGFYGNCTADEECVSHLCAWLQIIKSRVEMLEIGRQSKVYTILDDIIPAC